MDASILDFNPVKRVNCYEFCKAKDFVKLLIEGYNVIHKDFWNHCISNKESLNECVYGCIILNDKRLRPCHSHQKRLKNTLEEAFLSLQRAFAEKEAHINNFEDLFSFVEANSIGFGQISNYDTALRIAASTRAMHLMPKNIVYLHCGALKGAQYLWKIDEFYRDRNQTHTPYFNHHPYPKYECRVPITEFNNDLQEMGSSSLEDFLCVCQPLLRGLYLNLLHEYVDA